MTCPLTLVVIGGGAAGFFGAITAAEENPDARVILLEKHARFCLKCAFRVAGVAMSPILVLILQF